MEAIYRAHAYSAWKVELKLIVSAVPELARAQLAVVCDAQLL